MDAETARYRGLWIAAAIVFVVLAALTGYAFWNQWAAEERRIEAEQQKKVAKAQKQANQDLRYQTQITKSGLLSKSADARGWHRRDGAAPPPAWSCRYRNARPAFDMALSRNNKQCLQYWLMPMGQGWQGRFPSI